MILGGRRLLCHNSIVPRLFGKACRKRQELCTEKHPVGNRDAAVHGLRIAAAAVSLGMFLVFWNGSPQQAVDSGLIGDLIDAGLLLTVLFPPLSSIPEAGSKRSEPVSGGGFRDRPGRPCPDRQGWGG